MQGDFLKKHYYPFFIQLLGISLFITLILVVIQFFIFKFRHHYDLKKKIETAEYYFKNENYYQAIRLYSELNKQYALYEKAKKRLIQSYFASSTYCPRLYECGLHYLSNKKYYDDEIEELAQYLTEKQKIKFKSMFVRT